ncbi:N-6 DNA methylase [Actinomadura physcomitrii]|uniref:N-6 DNA methylase n=1 Tax=Actinomadura physcomitrii TaxID=2650748 RepID=UPI00136E9545
MRQEGHRGGEFRTPRSVAEVVAGIASPTPGDRILDPCCGSGDLLVATASLEPRAAGPVIGRALSSRPALWAGVNLALHGIPAQLSSDALDDLRHPAEPGELYDLIVTNPPFSRSPSGYSKSAAAPLRVFSSSTPAMPRKATSPRSSGSFVGGTRTRSWATLRFRGARSAWKNSATRTTPSTRGNSWSRAAP